MYSVVVLLLGGLGKKLLYILKVLTEGFQKLKVPHVLCGGVVIGWIR